MGLGDATWPFSVCGGEEGVQEHRLEKLCEPNVEIGAFWCTISVGYKFIFFVIFLLSHMMRFVLFFFTKKTYEFR